MELVTGWHPAPAGMAPLTDDVVRTALGVKQADIDLVRDSIRLAWDAYFTALSPAAPNRVPPPPVYMITGVVLGDDVITGSPVGSYEWINRANGIPSVLRQLGEALGVMPPMDQAIRINVDFPLMPFGWARLGESREQAIRRFIAVTLFHELTHWRQRDGFDSDQAYLVHRERGDKQDQYLMRKEEMEARDQAYGLTAKWLGPQPLARDVLAIINDVMLVHDGRLSHKWWHPLAMVAWGLLSVADYSAISHIITTPKLSEHFRLHDRVKVPNTAAINSLLPGLFGKEE